MRRAISRAFGRHSRRGRLTNKRFDGAHAPE